MCDKLKSLFTLTWSTKLALLQYCKKSGCCTWMLHMNLKKKKNQTTSEICCYNADVSAMTLTRFSDLKCSVQLKTFFLYAAWGSAWVKCVWVQQFSAERTELKGMLKWRPSSDVLLHLCAENTKRPVLEEAFKSWCLFGVPDHSHPTDRCLVIQQWVIKESTGKKGLSCRSTPLP